MLSEITTIMVYNFACAIVVGLIVRLFEFKVINEGRIPKTESFTRITLPTSPGSGSVIVGKLYV